MLTKQSAHPAVMAPVPPTTAPFVPVADAPSLADMVWQLAAEARAAGKTVECMDARYATAGTIAVVGRDYILFRDCWEIEVVPQDGKPPELAHPLPWKLIGLGAFVSLSPMTPPRK